MPRCALCGREEPETTRHHLVPRSRHKKKRNKNRFGGQDLRGMVLNLCRPCHHNLHAVLTEKELDRDFHTLEALAGHPEVAKFSAWIREKPAGLRVPIRRQKRPEDWDRRSSARPWL
jgi:hypothetical protein